MQVSRDMHEKFSVQASVRFVQGRRAQVTSLESGRIKHALTWGYHCVSPSPPFPTKNRPFSSARNPPFLWEFEDLTISTGSPLRTHGLPRNFLCPVAGNSGRECLREFRGKVLVPHKNESHKRSGEFRSIL